MSTLNIYPGKIKGYALVRDTEGRPKFDNFNDTIPQKVWDSLSLEDKLYIKEQRDGLNSHNSN